MSPATALARVDYNLTTNVVVDGEPNGPYTLTFTAQQNAAEGTQWPADSVMHLDFNNIVTFSSQDIVVSSGVTVTEQNSYYFLISGYNYSANAGQPLTVTINNVALNPNSTTVQNASGAQNLDLLSLGFSYINNKQGTDVHFSQATVPMIGVGQQGPKPQWNGKVVSWAAVDGATSYEIRYSSKGDDNYTTEEVTDTSKDLTSFVNQYGANDYGFYVYAKRGALQNQIPGYSSKTWHSVKVTPAARKIGNNYYSVGTNGGAVVGELVSGDTGDAFGEPDQNGAISGLFAEGDVIKLTANPEEGYDFEKWTNYIDYVEESWQSTERTDNPFQFEVKKDQTAMYGQLVQQDVPAQDLAVVLQLGDAHATLAASEALKQALQNCGFSSVTTQGSTINMTTPNKDGAYIVEVSDVQQSVRSAIYQATQMGEDAGERVFGIGLQSIENYGSYEDYTKEQQKEGRKPLKDGKELHVLWSKPTSEVEISVVAPTCGTEVTAEPSGEPGDEYDAWTQSPRPSVSVTTNNAEVTSDPYAGQGAYWMVPSEQNPYGSLFVGTFEGGSTYRAFLMLQPAFGFYFTKELNVTSSDGSPINVFAEDGIMVQTTVQVAVDVRVEHDWGDWTHLLDLSRNCEAA